MAQYKKEISTMLMRVVEQGLNQETVRKRSSSRLAFEELIILRHIHEHSNQPLMRLMDEIHFDRSYFHSILQKLLKSKWVEKHQVEEDKRQVIVKLTEKGEQILESEQLGVDQALDYFMKDLTINEEKGVLKFLSKLHQYIRTP